MQKLSFGIILLLAGTLLSSVSLAADVPVPAHKPVPVQNDVPVPALKPARALPQMIVMDDAALYKRIFTAQEQGDLSAANQDIAKLSDKRLMGYVLYQRYIKTDYKTGYEELSAWLEKYSDHPGANDIYKLAKKRGGEAGLTKPGAKPEIIKVTAQPVFQGRVYKSPAHRTEAQERSIKAMHDAVQKSLSKGNPDAAVEMVKADPAFAMLDTVERDLLKADIAAGYLSSGNQEKAYSLAARCVERSGLHVPIAGWIAGLSAWRAQDYEMAARYFEIPGRSPYATGWMAAGGAFWAARSYMRAGQNEQVSTWLKKAAAHSRSFYGLIATRALGRDFAFNWNVPMFTGDHYNTMAATSAGARAMALVAAGRNEWAQDELLHMDPKTNTTLRNAMVAYASYADLPGLAIRLGNAGTNEDGDYYDGALFPTGPWKPKEGYKVDPALIYAIARQESKFNPNATSPDGASGLMQIMPETAKTLVGDAIDLSRLNDPEYNLELGQKYLEKLLGEPHINNDLFLLLIAYNAGPGSLARWQQEMPDVIDPLLFIEMIPRPQTRAYVEKVLANYWLYHLREGLPTPTLDAVAAGQKPVYGTKVEMVSTP